ncbi:MAG: hypothetical protein ABIM32_00160 [candidate division WOR-3 bacterium]
MKLVKVVALLSGGLDSVLAALYMKRFNFEIFGLHFITPFSSRLETSKLRREYGDFYNKLGLKVEMRELGEEYLGMIRKPKFGYGRNVNPCIDCKILLFKYASEYMKEIGASFMITGEVLDQRPMSQRIHTMRLIEEEAGLSGIIVRPLSGALLPQTKPELDGLIKREWLLSIRGRQRVSQILLARELGLFEYKQPSGGCLLTDPEYARKVRDLINHNELDLFNVELLKIGRHFRIEKIKLVVGRNHEENQRIWNLCYGKGLLMVPLNTQGPTGFLNIQSLPHEEVLELALGILARYCDEKDNVEFQINIAGHEKIKKLIPFAKGKEEVESFRV